MVDDYVAINRANWNSRVPHHEIGYQLDDLRRDHARGTRCCGRSTTRGPMG